MPIQQADLEALIKDAFPDALVEIQDLAGDGDHYAAHITSQAFAGLSRVKQHQLVYNALKGKMGGELHALALQTDIPAENPV
ncbi:MAG: BolA family transcriptional regulator [Rhodospirillales bacterium]|nr:BolA family transcriptional regulator [Rhodospirillales bacterium]MCB9965688.1 BolA family transcriptional regulator [Rhodospirillales bacterium]